MKKLIALLLALVMCFTLVACGSDKENDDKLTPPDTEPSVTEKVPDGTTDEPVVTEPTEEKEEGMVHYNKFPFVMDFEFDRQVVYEKDGIKVTAIKLFFDEWDGLHFQYAIEDEKGRDLTLTSGWEGQGYVINDCSFWPTNDSVDDPALQSDLFQKKELAFFGIDNIYSFELRGAQLYDSEADEHVTESFDIDLEIKNKGKQPEFEVDGELLYDGGDYQVYFKYGQFGVWDEVCPVIVVKNNYEKDVSIRLYNVRRDDEALEEQSVFAVVAYPYTHSANDISHFIETDYDADYTGVQKGVFDIDIQSGDGTVYHTIKDYEINWQFERELPEE